MTSKVLGSWPPEHGAVQAVAPHVEHLLAPNPSSWTYEGTNSYVIAHGGASVLIDPAVTDATHLDALRRRGQHDGRQVSAILLTHDHPDHSDGARELAELVDAPIVCFSPRFADEQPAHEQLIDLDGLPIHVLHTPGHSDDSLCLWIPENDVLITGDTLLGKRSAGVMGSLGELFTSIAMLRDLVGSRTVTALPGHGPDFDDVAGSVARVESVRARRIDQVRAHIADGNTTLEVLWTAIPAVILLTIAVPTVRTSDCSVYSASKVGTPQPNRYRLVSLRAIFWKKVVAGCAFSRAVMPTRAK